MGMGVGVTVLRPIVQEAGRGGWNFKPAGQCLAKCCRFALDLKGCFGRQLQRLEQRGDYSRAVRGSNAERIARLIVQARSCQRNLDMACFLGRSASDNRQIVTARALKSTRLKSRP